MEPLIPIKFVNNMNWIYLNFIILFHQIYFNSTNWRIEEKQLKNISLTTDFNEFH